MSKPFELGKVYKAKNGNNVVIVQEKTAQPGYDCVKGDDNIWRYNRESDRGRVTGSNFDMSDRKNLIPED